MLPTTPLLSLLGLATLALSTPLAPRADAYTRLTPAQLQSIAPATSTCANAPFPTECATATQAAPQLCTAFRRYAISSPYEQAALLSLILFETGSLKYNRNHFPGVPGQGTRNMQSPAFNALYATALASAGRLPAADVDAAKAQGVGGVLDLLVKKGNEDVDFGSAAWFLSSQCSAGVRAGLQAGSQAGWEGYLTGCVGTTVTEERRAGWQAAVKGLVG